MNTTVRGMREHLEAAREFEVCAQRATSPQSATRMLNAAVYSLRACVDNLRSASKRGELVIGLRGLDRLLDELLPRQRLIRKLRNHHFHEEALLGPPHMRVSLQIGVPALCTATIGLTVNPSAPGFSILGAVEGQTRFLLISGWLIQDEREAEPVALPALVHDQRLDIAARLSELTSLFRRAA